ncbi:MAG: hypothetical protein IJJ72_08965 [Bacteroidales bacterium]|jgi:hypothetical protein|nr:hypothetical protein [Bacteroidales bacterium]
MEKRIKKMYVAPASETLELCCEGFLCVSTRRSSLQDYELQEEEDW